MKKVLFAVICVLLLGTTNFVKASDSVCTECDLLNYTGIAYYVVNSDNWWTGVVITNTNLEDAYIRIDADGVERFTVPGKSNKVFILDSDRGYAIIRSDIPVFTYCIISNNQVATSYEVDFKDIE